MKSLLKLTTSVLEKIVAEYIQTTGQARYVTSLYSIDERTGWVLWIL